MSLGTAYIATAGFAYLLGSIPFGYILVRLFLKQDIRATGSGNIGATNVARSGRTGLAIATLLLDGAKGLAAVLIAHLFITSSAVRMNVDDMFDPVLVVSLASLCAIVGHMFPVWLRFRGGKGVATGAGAFVALAPIELAATLVLFALVVALTRYVSLGSIAATVSFPILLWAFRPDWRMFPVCFVPVVIGSVLIIFRHKDNIRRLLNGTESKFGRSKFPSSPTQMEKQA